jgi:hypothetical protein
MTREEKIAQERYDNGEAPKISTFIDEDTIIMGYGNLDYDFEFPLPMETIRKIHGTTSWSKLLKMKEAEELKQETIEEVAEKFAKKFGSEIDSTRYYAFINGAKWQQEQDKKLYSEEEVKKWLINCKDRFGGSDLSDYVSNSEVIDWFEQFKKK